jgi:hypothetical protein
LTITARDVERIVAGDVVANAGAGHCLSVRRKYIQARLPQFSVACDSGKRCRLKHNSIRLAKEMASQSSESATSIRIAERPTNLPPSKTLMNIGQAGSSNRCDTSNTSPRSVENDISRLGPKYKSRRDTVACCHRKRQVRLASIAWQWRLPTIDG